ncbi:MAG: hypothetical protein EBU82_00365 [Flavobacteriia bacterium]|nr:hypothetical protein [Flavobacteriia bacterium]
MRTLKASQKGKGWFGNRLKNFRRFITGRRRKMKTRAKLPATFKIASKKTEKRESTRALQARPKIQKALNKVLYKKGELKSVPSPKRLNDTVLEITGNGNIPEESLQLYLEGLNIDRLGIADMMFKYDDGKIVSKNKRDKFDAREAKIPDSELPDPGPIPYRPTRNPVGNIDLKETQIQAQVRILPILYAIHRRLFSAQDVLSNDYATVVESLRENGQPIFMQDIPEANLRAFLRQVDEVYEEANRVYPKQSFTNFYEAYESARQMDPNRPPARNKNILKDEFRETELAKEKQKDNAISQALFYASAQTMQQVINRLEYAGPTNQERYIVNTVERSVDGEYQEIQKIAVSGAGGIDRYFGFLLGGLDYIKLTYEHDSQRCLKAIPFRIQGPSEVKGNRKPRDVFRPLVTLKSNDCLTMFNGIKNFLLHSTMEIDSELFRSNWIVLRKDYFPLKGGDEGGGGGPMDFIVAKAFPHASYIQKALDDWAIDAIDPALYSLFNIKYPFYSMKISTYMTTPERFLRLKTTVERERSDYPVGAGSFDFVNFMIVDKQILQEKSTFLAHVNPFEGSTKLNELMTQAIQSQAIYAVSPYIAFFMKRKYLNTFYNVFKTPNVSKVSDPLTQILRIYTNLPTAQEKITFDYLHYLYVLETFQEEVTQPLNQGRAAANQYQERFLRIQSLYREPLTRQQSDQILRLFTTERVEALTNLQSMVDSQAPNTTPQFIRSVLRKFTGTVLQGTFNNAYQEGRLGVTQRAINTRKAQRNTVQAQINALEQEKANLAKAWNPFTKKTRKLRQNQIEANGKQYFTFASSCSE